MAFNLSTAKPVGDTQGVFQLSSARMADPMINPTGVTQMIPEPELVPLFEKLDPEQYPLSATLQEAGIAGGKFLSGLGLGLPEIALEAMGFKIPEPEGFASEVLSAGAELGGLLVTGGKIGESVVPRTTGKVIPAAAREAVTGAVVGVGMKPDPDLLAKDDPMAGAKFRAMQATLGATGGAALGAVGAGLAKTGRGIKRVLRGAPKAAKKIEDQKSILQKTMDEVAQLDAEEASLKIQEKLPKFFRENSKAYGSALDDIAENQKVKITRGDLLDAIEQTKVEAQEELLITAENKALKALDKLTERYQTGSIDDVVDLRQILKDKQAVRKSLPVPVQSGTRGLSSDDIPVTIFEKNIGNIIEEAAPELKKLNRSYAPVIQAMKKSHKTFKPFQGQFETKTGTTFLKKAMQGKLEAGEQRFLDMIKKGAPDFAEGVGDIDAKGRRVYQAAQRRLAQLEQRGIDVKRLVNKKNAFKEVMQGVGGIGGGAASLEILRRTIEDSLKND